MTHLAAALTDGCMGQPPPSALRPVLEVTLSPPTQITAQLSVEGNMSPDVGEDGGGDVTHQVVHRWNTQ